MGTDLPRTPAPAGGVMRRMKRSFHIRFDSFPSKSDEALGERREMVRPRFGACQPVIHPEGWIL
jgi:hypothetical protein